MDDIGKSYCQWAADMIQSSNSSNITNELPTRRLSVVENTRVNDENCPTASSEEQAQVEKSCLKLYQIFLGKGIECSALNGEHLTLERSKTIKFLRKGLVNLSEGYECLDSSRPWILYWILHAMELLGENVTDRLHVEAIIDFLSKCQNSEGGFGGGPGQISHLAPTYAAINALCILGTESAYKVIDREKLVSWMNKLRLKNGSFLMHEDGEVDIRGVYCALSVARITNIYSPELFKNTHHWVMSCQTYEGGFGGTPGMEAHGGYAFCGFASLVLLGKAHLCNVKNLLRWATNKQMSLEGGFQGRTNKLVDGCYSFWQGGIFPLVHLLLSQRKQDPESLLFSVNCLQEYLLICCQDSRGGLIDKPGKSRDFYHTCYTLSGLSVAQYILQSDNTVPTPIKANVIGYKENTIKATHPLYNIGLDNSLVATEFFNLLPVPRC
jgi:protein farnesyltransferase subunit beta